MPKAFTLIELLVVVAILGILSTIGVITYIEFIASSHKKKAELTINTIYSAQSEYQSNNNEYCISDCNSKSGIVNNLLDGVDKLSEQKYNFTISGNTNNQTFTIQARHQTSAPLRCNAASWDRVTDWMAIHARTVGDVTITPRRDETAMIAVQGPSAGDALRTGCAIDVDDLRRFAVSNERMQGKRPQGDIGLEVSRTGYTGEDGYELIVEAAAATAVWDSLVNDGGAVPCGLGARDTLRLEAGLSLYGQDIDTTTTPLEAGLDRFVDLTGDFIGSDALRRQSNEGVTRRLVGLAVEGRSAPRHGYEIRAPRTDDVIGTVTSGGPSPTLGGGIGLGYLRIEHTAPGTEIEVNIRGKPTRGEVVPIPFYQLRRHR